MKTKFYAICEIQLNEKETLAEAKTRFLKAALACNASMNALGGVCATYKAAKAEAAKHNKNFKTSFKKCPALTNGVKFAFFAYPAWVDHEGKLQYDWTLPIVEKLCHC